MNTQQDIFNLLLLIMLLMNDNNGCGCSDDDDNNNNCGCFGKVNDVILCCLLLNSCKCNNSSNTGGLF